MERAMYYSEVCSIWPQRMASYTPAYLHTVLWNMLRMLHHYSEERSIWLQRMASYTPAYLLFTSIDIFIFPSRN